VYLKKKARNQGANFPGDAAGGLCGVALKMQQKKTRKSKNKSHAFSRSPL